MGVYGPLIVIILLPLVAKMTEIPPGCKIRITSKGLELRKTSTVYIILDKKGIVTQKECAICHVTSYSVVQQYIQIMASYQYH